MKLVYRVSATMPQPPATSLYKFCLCLESENEDEAVRYFRHWFPKATIVSVDLQPAPDARSARSALRSAQA
jgi:hypothetical protein